MSLDAINAGFAAARDENNPDVTLAESGVDMAQIANDVVTALDTGSNEITTDDIQLLLTNASNLTVDQAVAYMYQMLSLVDTDSTTEDIELGGVSFAEALATELGIEDTDGDGFENDIEGELSDIADVFGQADVTLEGLDDDLNNATVENDAITLNFSDNDDIPSIFDELEDGTIEALGFTGLDDGSDTDGIVSWGYIPDDPETAEVEDGDVGIIDDETGLAAGQVVASGGNGDMNDDDDDNQPNGDNDDDEN